MKSVGNGGGMLAEEPRRLLVYQRAIETVGTMEDIARAIPASRADLRDQLRRAASSIPLNIAEGAAEFRTAEKSRFYRMARRSAWECMAVMDVLLVLGAVRDTTVADEHLRRVSGMLSGLLRSLASQKN